MAAYVSLKRTASPRLHGQAAQKCGRYYASLKRRWVRVFSSRHSVNIPQDPNLRHHC